jgi:hypothetical protein
MNLWWLIRFVVMPVAGGLLAASAFIIAKKPEAKDMLAKLAPYQGGIGVAMFGLGIYNALDIMDYIDAIGTLPFLGITALLTIFSLVVVGFLLGFNLIAQWIPGEGAAEKKGAAIQAKLATFSAPLGFVSIVAGVLCLILFFKYS